MQNVHHENLEPEIISDQSQQPRRLTRTADAQALVACRTQNAPVPRRGLKRSEAALYIGISDSKFDELVKDGRMPPPKRMDGCARWDIRQLDTAFDKLPGGDDNDQNPWDE